MNNFVLTGFVLLLFSFNLTCQQEGKSVLESYNIDSKSNEMIYLPKELKEISGLAYAGDGFLFMHNDEKGIAYKFDLKKQKVIAEYELGEKHVKKDFEDIDVLKDSVYMITSDGVLYKFSLHDGKDEIPFEKIKTGLDRKNNIEGLCFDPKTNSFLFACKDYPGKGYKDYRAVYEFDIVNKKLKPEPRFLISLEQLKQEYDIKDFSPSGIELHKKSGHFFLISASPEVIIELDSKGNLINAKKFNDKIHKQPEGITFLNNNSMVISDEAKDKKAKITIFRKRK